MRNQQSEYMHWAKTQSRARYNLATSGVGAFPLSELGLLPTLEINGDNSYGYAPLVAGNRRASPGGPGLRGDGRRAHRARIFWLSPPCSTRATRC